LANGHDVCAFVGIALRHLIGSRKVPQTWGSEIEAGLALAFDEQMFKKTAVYSSLATWELQSQTFRLFKKAA